MVSGLKLEAFYGDRNIYFRGKKYMVLVIKDSLDIFY